MSAAKDESISTAKLEALTPKARIALDLLSGTNYRNTLSAKALAGRLWPEKLAACGTYLRRGGLYRAAGAYYSKLQKKGLVGHWITDFDSGYYITQKGVEALTPNV
jgi:hypothetical protein